MPVLLASGSERPATIWEGCFGRVVATATNPSFVVSKKCRWRICSWPPANSFVWSARSRTCQQKLRERQIEQRVDINSALRR